jgi:cytochrome c553
MTKLQITLLAVALGLATSAAAQGDPVAGKAKSVVCTGCHGIPGIRAAFPDVYSVPKLGGQQAQYIVSALKAYKAGDRFSGTMKGQASALSDKDMANVAAYYSGAVAQVAAKK